MFCSHWTIVVVVVLLLLPPLILSGTGTHKTTSPWMKLLNEMLRRIHAGILTRVLTTPRSDINLNTTTTTTTTTTKPLTTKENFALANSLALAHGQSSSRCLGGTNLTVCPHHAVAQSNKSFCWLSHLIDGRCGGGGGAKNIVITDRM
jgi:hypothetical protein